MRYSHHTIKSGTRSKLLFVFARSGEAPTAGATGLGPSIPGAAAGYAREGETAAHPIPLVDGVLGRHTTGGLVEVDPRLLPGVYQFGVPDAVLADGSPRAILMLRLPGAIVDPVEVALVAYDPLDSWCMGVEGLANRRRHEFLRRALPRLTEMELALGEEAERELAARLRSDEGEG
ncbi:MAG: hypothetical protein H0W27_01710 [Actinobacteria bacterium]|nr:hypothetical protein [Actinomycetota bacterium]